MNLGAALAPEYSCLNIKLPGGEDSCDSKQHNGNDSATGSIFSGVFFTKQLGKCEANYRFRLEIAKTIRVVF